MDYHQHVILFNNLLAYFDSIISALYHSCSQTRFSQDCNVVEDRLKLNLSKFHSLQTIISCEATSSTSTATIPPPPATAFNNTIGFNNIFGGCDILYNLYSSNTHLCHPHQQQQPPLPSFFPQTATTYPSYITTNPYENIYQQSTIHYSQTPFGIVYYNNNNSNNNNTNNSEQDEEYSEQDTESSSSSASLLSSSSADIAKASDVQINARVPSFLTVSSKCFSSFTEESSRSTSPESRANFPPNKSSSLFSLSTCSPNTILQASGLKSYKSLHHHHHQSTQPLLLRNNEKVDDSKDSNNHNITNGDNRNDSTKSNNIQAFCQSNEMNEFRRKYDAKPLSTSCSASSFIFQKPSKPIVDNDGFILVNRRIQKARERRERILQKRKETFRNHKRKSEFIKNETLAQKENLGQTIEERQKRAEINRNEIQLQKIRKAQAEDDKIKINSLVVSIDAHSKKGTLYLKDASSSRRIEQVKARKWQQFALRDALFNARREYCETKELQRREQIKSQSQLKLLKAEEARREKIESKNQKKEQTWAEKTDAIKKRKEKENDDLKKKIKDKIIQQQKRYQENLEQKRQKAFELSVVRSSLLPSINDNNNHNDNHVDDNALVCEFYNPIKICKLCCVKIKSEVYLFGHIQSRLHCDMFDKHLKTIDSHSTSSLTHEEKHSLNMSFIVDSQEDSILLSHDNIASFFGNLENQSSYYGKKNFRFVKKLKKYLTSQIEKYDETFVQNDVQQLKCDKIQKFIARINESIHNQTIKVLQTRLELLFNQLQNEPRKIDRHTLEVFISSLVTVSTTVNNCSSLVQSNENSNENHIILATHTCYEAIIFHLKNSNKNCQFLEILSRTNMCLTLIELFAKKLDTCSFDCYNNLDIICRLITKIFDYDSFISQIFDEQKRRTHQLYIEALVKYIFAIGVYEKLCQFIAHRSSSSFNHDCNHHHAQTTSMNISDGSIFTFPCLIIDLLEAIFMIVFNSKSQLDYCFDAIKNTQFSGLVSYMYEMVFRTGSSIRNEEIADKFTDDKLRIVIKIFEMFNRFPIDIVQNVLGQEGISLQIRHLCSFLIWIMKTPEKNCKINVIFEFISHFTIHNSDNQTLLRCGASPTVLEQLLQLDISYFIIKNKNSMIIPALISLCYNDEDNLAVMRNHLSSAFVLEFIDEIQTLNVNQYSDRKLSFLHTKDLPSIRNFFALQI